LVRRARERSKKRGKKEESIWGPWLKRKTSKKKKKGSKKKFAKRQKGHDRGIRGNVWNGVKCL